MEVISVDGKVKKTDLLKPFKFDIDKNAVEQKIADLDRMDAEKEKEKHAKDVRDSGVGEKFWGSSFENYVVENETQRKAVYLLKNYAKDPKDKAILLLGNCGLGKTHLVTAMMYECKLKPKFVTMREICIEMEVSRSFKADKNTKQVLMEYATAPLLVVDEICRGTNEKDEQMFHSFVLGYRYDNRLPTVKISNFPYEAVKKTLGKDIIDRLKEISTSLIIEGESWRGRK